MLHSSASAELRQRQYQLGISNKTSALQKIASGMKWFTDTDWESISVPFALLHGDDDKVTPLDKASSIKDLNKNYCKELKVFKDSGHNFMMEHPTLVNDAIIDFLKSIQILD